MLFFYLRSRRIKRRADDVRVAGQQQHEGEQQLFEADAATTWAEVHGQHRPHELAGGHIAHEKDGTHVVAELEAAAGSGSEREYP